MAADPQQDSRFRKRLFLYYGLYTVGLLVFIVMMGAIERVRGPGVWLGYVFLFVTIAFYACIGLICRTADLTEYYVAGRRVPAFFNGMATAADWMSAASFIGLAGIVFASGYEGLAYVMGWTGGYCLVAFLLAPYLRKFGGYTVPDFLANRYGNGERGGSSVVRGIAVLGATLCSFVYLVAQIQGVGLVVTRFIGVEFSVGVFFGLAGILVCSFLGGMRAVTWTQVAQYIIMIASFLGVVAMIGWHRHHDLLPQLSTGHLLEQIEVAEQRIAHDPAEQAVRDHFLTEAQALQDRISHLPQSFEDARDALNTKLRLAREHNAPLVAGVVVDHVEVHVVRQRVGNRQQQAIGGRERGRQRASRNQAGQHVRQARNLGGGQHHHVGLHHHLGPLDDAVAIDVVQRQDRGIDLAPGHDPLR